MSIFVFENSIYLLRILDSSLVLSLDLQCVCKSRQKCKNTTNEKHVFKRIVIYAYDTRKSLFTLCVPLSARPC